MNIETEVQQPDGNRHGYHQYQTGQQYNRLKSFEGNRFTVIANK
jgi:hypothetical protein